jgi:GntR family transcriptional regulator/MocR family aminotransferase
MVLLKIQRDGELPIFQQIIQQVMDLIEDDALQEGESLPSSRKLAQSLGLDRTTVQRAYLELGALGYLESCPGSYTRVRRRAKVVTPQASQKKSKINWQEKAVPECEYLYHRFLEYCPESAENMPPDLINLSPLDLDHRIFPVTEFRRCLNQVLVNMGSKLLSYGEYQGFEPLRQDIAHRLQIHGISVTPDEILITNGAQQAIELILKLLGSRQSYIAIEEPTYANVIPLIHLQGLQISGIPMESYGMNLRVLEDIMNNQKPALVYTIPNFQNPTGITTSQAHREQLLTICEKHSVPLIEDGFEEEMKYFGKVVLPIKSMDKQKVVIYLSTFSKVLFPGIRMGWIAADKECIARLTAIKRFCDLSSSNVIQAALSAFIRNGYYDIHLRRMHRTFRKRMLIALEALEMFMPENVKWTKPDGGYTIWVSLSYSYGTENTFKKTLINNGVLVSPGIYYFYGSKEQKYFRISISSLNEKEIPEGIKRLGNALRQLIS